MFYRCREPMHPLKCDNLYNDVQSGIIESKRIFPQSHKNGQNGVLLVRAFYFLTCALYYL